MMQGSLGRMNYTEPFVSTPEDIIPEMLALASLKPDDVLFDLGSGDGRILMAAARDHGVNAVGVEFRRSLVRECLRKVNSLGLSQQVTIVCGNFKRVSLRRADVLVLYLSSYTLNLMAPKFMRELGPDVRIVNFDYPIPGWTPAREVQVTPD